MPSKSPAQHRLMEAVAHDPGFAKKSGIPQSVGTDFVKSDAGRTFDHEAHRAAQKADARSAPTMRPAGPGGKRRAE
jgi:hypothetical protein